MVKKTERPEGRAGFYVRQPTGYRAFIPALLPPTPRLQINDTLLNLLSDADRAIGRLDAAAELLPNPDRFVAMYVRREAVYSSQIEGTQASLTDLLAFEADAARRVMAKDVGEVVNYVAAMNHGLERLRSLPLSLRLIRQIHEKLMQGVRGGEREPGEFRRSQNWIGPPGSSLKEALFIPPPPSELMTMLGNLEKFLHDKSPMPPLIRCGLAHAQFETIHPFLDGNGRVGRLLITFWLCWKGVLRRPLLYLSDYFKRKRDDYYANLQRVRDEGDWEGWTEFFLEGVRSVATEAAAMAGEIQKMREKHRGMVSRRPRAANGQVLLDHLLEKPMITVKQVEAAIGKTYPVAADLVGRFEKWGLLREETGLERNRIYSYRPYLTLLGEEEKRR
jgi:Fic family protein